MKNKIKFYLFTIIATISLIPNASFCQEWVQINAQFDPPGQYHIANAKFTDKETCWFSMYIPPVLFKTSDGCKTFNSQFIDDSLYYLCLDFIDKNNGWISAEKIEDQRPFMYRTRDGGNTWTMIALEKPLSPIKFLDSLNGIGGHYNSRSIYWTDNGGLTWQPAELPDSNRFEMTKCTFTTKKKGFAIGCDSYETDSGLIYETHDGGHTWSQSLALIDIPEVSGIAFADSINGFVVSTWIFPLIHTTHDGGNSWSTTVVPGTENLNDVSFENDSIAWAVGFDKVLKSADKGVTWTSVEGLPRNNYYQVIFLHKERVGYILGSSNSVFKYEMGPVSVKEKNTIKKDYWLHQNYPNPFNPTTTIEYKIPEEGYVKLTIYNCLGENIKTLFDARQKSGSYKVSFDGEGLASGIYFYKISFKNSTQVKKMLLLQ